MRAANDTHLLASVTGEIECISQHCNEVQRDMYNIVYAYSTICNSHVECSYCQYY